MGWRSRHRLCANRPISRDGRSGCPVCLFKAACTIWWDPSHQTMALHLSLPSCMFTIQTWPLT
jgi:hypothetical protein